MEWLLVAVGDHAHGPDSAKPLRSRRPTTLTVDATPSTSHQDSSESPTSASDSDSPAGRGDPTGASQRSWDIPVPQTVKEKTVEVVKVIPQERVS